MRDRTAFEASIEKRQFVKHADTAGQIADSMDVRLALMARVHSGEITLEEAQKQLKKIQGGAKAKGLMTRAQAYNEG
jgi:hypothetical protein